MLYNQSSNSCSDKLRTLTLTMTCTHALGTRYVHPSAQSMPTNVYPKCPNDRLPKGLSFKFKYVFQSIAKLIWLKYLKNSNMISSFGGAHKSCLTTYKWKVVSMDWSKLVVPTVSLGFKSSQLQLHDSDKKLYRIEHYLHCPVEPIFYGTRFATFGLWLKVIWMSSNMSTTKVMRSTTNRWCGTW